MIVFIILKIYPTTMMSLIADFLMIIVVSASILYSINKKPENKAIVTDDDNDDNEKEEENEFISEWISAIKEIVEEHGNKFNRSEGVLGKLCSHKNPKVLDLIKVYPDKINWVAINYNREPWAIKLLTDNINKIDWDVLCRCDDEFSINLLIDNKDKIRWATLCRNKNPKVIQLLKERIEYENNHNINRTNSSYHDNSNKIDWGKLQQNPNSKELIMNRINDEFSGMIEFGALYIRVNNILPILLETIKNKDTESVKIFKKLIMRDLARNEDSISINWWSTILNTLFNDE
jgi:hypothetical protein